MERRRSATASAEEGRAVKTSRSHPKGVVLTQSVSDGRLAGLRQDGVSYVFAGERELCLPAALETLNRELGISRLLLEGGGAANGALQDGLVGEWSLVGAPSVEGVPGAPPCRSWASSRRARSA